MFPVLTVFLAVRRRACLRLVLLAALFASPAFLAAAPVAGDWWGIVTWVVDGDTVRVRPLDKGGRAVPVRLHGIDAPEVCQNGGTAARDALERQLKGQLVLIHSQAHDQYGRVIARLDVNGQDPAARMVALGLAWSYQFRTGQGPYVALQRHAASQQLGVFASGPAEEPAAFRKRHGACAHPPRLNRYR